jgi:hypothetical protein
VLRSAYLERRNLDERIAPQRFDDPRLDVQKAHQASMRVVAVASMRISVCWSPCSPVPAASYAFGTTTPNCQRILFFDAEAVYGYSK